MGTDNSSNDPNQANKDSIRHLKSSQKVRNHDFIFNVCKQQDNNITKSNLLA